MAAMWSRIFFLSFFGTPHFPHDSETPSIRRLVKSGKGAAASFLRYNHYECHALLDVDSRIDKYLPT